MSKKDQYLLRLLDENIDMHNHVAVYRTVLDRHGLLNEANELLHKIMPDSYDINGKEIQSEQEQNSQKEKSSS